MSTITVYTFEDENGNEAGSFSTQDPCEAEAYARRATYNVRANEFEYSDGYPVPEWQFADLLKPQGPAPLCGCGARHWHCDAV